MATVEGGGWLRWPAKHHLIFNAQCLQVPQERSSNGPQRVLKESSKIPQRFLEDSSTSPQRPQYDIFKDLVPRKDP